LRDPTTDRSDPADTDPQRLHLSFLISAPDLGGCPKDGRPEVAIAGRSNAGKSSVLNRLSGSRHTAKVSKVPGRTRLLNFFSVREAGEGRLVDLPGYGYARAGRREQNRWQAAVNEYLSRRDNLTALVLVMDIRHPLQAYDREIIDWASASALPLLILLNKADKLKYGAQQQALTNVKQRMPPEASVRVIPFSAETGLNLRELQAFLLQNLNADG
jgi:GTP-binding protein